jgi:hypothetical protein
LLGKEPHNDNCVWLFTINIGRAFGRYCQRCGFLAASGSGFVMAQMLTVDGARMDYICHG